jgi:DNA-binding transcriptional ArsR family regulator
VSNVFDAIPDDARVLIIKALERREPDLVDELSAAERPTNTQSDAVINVLSHALSANYGPGYMPNEYGLAVERAIDAYLEVWPIHR